MLHMKEQDKTSKKKLLHEMKISSLPNKEFKVMVLKMLTGLERRVDELRTSRDKKY